MDRDFFKESFALVMFEFQTQKLTKVMAKIKYNRDAEILSIRQNFQDAEYYAKGDVVDNKLSKTLIQIATSCGMILSQGKFATFRKIVDRAIVLHEKKNTDYGNTFDELCDKYGLIVAIIEISKKVNRIVTIIKNNTIQVKDEKLEDSIMDLMCYAVMTDAYIKRKQN